MLRSLFHVQRGDKSMLRSKFMTYIPAAAAGPSSPSKIGSIRTDAEP